VSGTALEDTLVSGLARTAVERTAPEELPLFGPTSEAFFDDPEALERGGGGDELLGFGAEAAVVLVTPVALSVAKDVVRFVADQLRTRLKTEGEGAIQAALDRVFGPHDRDETAHADLTDEELQRVHAIALEKARQLRLSPDRAGILADAIVGGLATG
jgi:hypothetical protein